MWPPCGNLNTFEARNDLLSDTLLRKLRTEESHEFLRTLLNSRSVSNFCPRRELIDVLMKRADIIVDRMFSAEDADSRVLGEILEGLVHFSCTDKGDCKSLNEVFALLIQIETVPTVKEGFSEAVHGGMQRLAAEGKGLAQKVAQNFTQTEWKSKSHENLKKEEVGRPESTDKRRKTREGQSLSPLIFGTNQN